MNNSKPIIGVDIGGTLEYTWESKRIWFREKGFDIGEFPMSRNDVIHMLSGNERLYKEMHKHVYTDDAILNRYPLPNACEAIGILSKKFRIYLISTRSAEQIAVTMKWLEKIDIRRFIEDIVMIEHRAESKLEWCKQTRAQVLIDDDIVHLVSDKNYDNILKINLSGNPRCLMQNLPSVLFAQNWKEALRIIDERVDIGS